MAVSDKMTMGARRRYFVNPTDLQDVLHTVVDKAGVTEYVTIASIIDRRAIKAVGASTKLTREDGPAYLRRQLEKQEALVAYAAKIKWPSGGGAPRGTQQADPARKTDPATIDDINAMLAELSGKSNKSTKRPVAVK